MEYLEAEKRIKRTAARGIIQGTTPKEKGQEGEGDIRKSEGRVA